MKDYIVEAGDGLTDKIRADVQQVLDQTGGKVVKVGAGGSLMLVNASEDAVRKIKALDGVSNVNENHRRIIPRPGIKPPRFGL